MEKPKEVSDAASTELKCVLAAWAERHGAQPVFTSTLVFTLVDFIACTWRITLSESADLIRRVLTLEAQR